MANATINVGKTAASMANTAVNMASTVMNMVNSATSLACHKQTDARTTLDPRHLQLTLQGNTGKWQRSSLKDCGKLKRIYRQGPGQEVTLGQSTSHASWHHASEGELDEQEAADMCFGVLCLLRQNGPTFFSSQLTCSVVGESLIACLGPDNT